MMGNILDDQLIFFSHPRYILFLAVNGISEAFVFAVAKGAYITGSSFCLAVSFVVFWYSSIPLVRQQRRCNTSYVILFSG